MLFSVLVLEGLTMFANLSVFFEMHIAIVNVDFGPSRIVTGLKSVESKVMKYPVRLFLRY